MLGDYLLYYDLIRASAVFFSRRLSRILFLMTVFLIITVLFLSSLEFFFSLNVYISRLFNTPFPPLSVSLVFSVCARVH